MGRDQTYGTRALATLLDITSDQARHAIDIGLLASDDNRTATAKALEDALADLDAFHQALHASRPVDPKTAAKMLSMSVSSAMQTLHEHHVPLLSDEMSWQHQHVAELADRLAGRAPNPHASRAKPTNRTRGRILEVDENVAQRQRLRVRVASGSSGPRKVVIHAGPTNSGKTHESIAQLAQRGRGVYAGPLRMLAREAATKLSALVGEDSVGLVTGEEQENPEAPIICATAEAAPLDHGGLLILDEAHWLSDPDRGWAWTRALIASDFEEIHVICDPAAVDMVSALVPDADELVTVDHERLAPLEYAGTLKLEDAPSGSAVVVFSRAAVLAVADELAKAGRTPAVLYGALPPAARAAQVQRLIDGQADVMVTTDVIGHGINLPLTAVVLGETSKYDGTQRRDLHLWEAAQILGRAGRYGHGSDTGHAYALEGSQWFTPDAHLIRAATAAAAGKASTQWQAPARAAVRPTLGELNADSASDLPVAVVSFARTIEKAAGVLPIETFEPTGVLARLAGILALPGARTLDIGVVWGLAMCPIDDETLAVDAAGALLGVPEAKGRIRDRARLAADPTGGLAEAEAAAGAARNLRAVTLAVGDLPGVSAQDAVNWEQDAGQAVCFALGTPGALSGHGSCKACGRACAPWFGECDKCHSARKLTATTPRGGGADGKVSNRVHLERGGSAGPSASRRSAGSARSGLGTPRDGQRRGGQPGKRRKGR